MKTNSKFTSMLFATLLTSGVLASSNAASWAADAPDMKQMKMSPAGNDGSTAGYEKAMSGMMKQMDAPLTGKPDLDFVKGMMPHHQGAIEMAKVVLQYGKDSEVKKLAQEVIKAQEGEIVFMEDWLAKANQSTLPVVADAIKPSEQAIAAMMNNMMTPYSGNADVDFIQGMIPHHQGAIEMAKIALQFAKDPALLKLAQDIVNAQEAEISFMNDWLKRHGH